MSPQHRLLAGAATILLALAIAALHLTTHLRNEPAPTASALTSTATKFVNPVSRLTSDPIPTSDDPIARALAANPEEESGATDDQRLAFAALQRHLAQSDSARLREKAAQDPKSYHGRELADGGATFHNPAQAIGVAFESTGAVAVHSSDGADWSWQMEALDLPETGALSIDEARAERTRGHGITEWYVNEERGLEQFFTLEHPITQNTAGESRIRVAMTTDLQADLVDENHVEFIDETGEVALHYHGLAVVDAEGMPLPARMEIENLGPEGPVVALVFDTAGAQFPVTVDPFVSTVIYRMDPNGGSSPNEFTLVSGTTFVFSANDGVHGEELWKSDGTAAGTVMIKDIWPGSNYSSPQGFTVAGSTVFFSADDNVAGRELWKTDLTESGTEMVIDLDPGSGDGVTKSQGAFHTIGGRILFVGDDGASGLELWSSNGTEAGTGIVKDIYSGSGSSGPSEFALFSGELFFEADDGLDGSELWKTDGTLGGTVMVADVNPGSASSYPSELVVFDGALYFNATDEDGYEVWKSDGMVGGTTEQLKDIRDGADSSSPRRFFVFDGALFFIADDGLSGTELWKTDGTEGGTEMVKDIYPGAVGSSPGEFALMGGFFYFKANDSVHGTELWKSDGTTVGTVLLADIDPGTDDSDPSEMTPFGSVFYFRANDGVIGSELWMSDGTVAGTVLVKDCDPRIESDGEPFWGSPRRFFEAGGTVFFEGANELDDELWTTDGTEAGTVLFKDINRTGYLFEDPVRSGDRIFFLYEEDNGDYTLWVSDGTAAGTHRLEPAGYDYGWEPENLTDVAGTLFFSMRHDDFGEELWKSNGTDAGTSVVRDIVPGDDGSDPENLTAVGNLLFFTADDDDVNGRELWKSDGTTAGTVLVKDIRPGASGSSPEELTDLDGMLLFAADDGTTGDELWKSDGTTAGTVMVKDIDPGGSGGGIEYMTAVPDLGLVFFEADDDVHGDELWKSDGTEDGTVMVKDIEDGSSSSNPDYLTPAGSTLFFQAETTADGTELWKSDGTEAGTILVKNIGAGADSSDPETMTAVGDLLYFLADDGTHGLELWMTDGTDAGTMMVEDFVAGAESSLSEDTRFIASGGKLYFTGDRQDGAWGDEVYSADATGTLALEEDLIPGPESSIPLGLIDLNGQLLWFGADDLGAYTLRSEPGDVMPDLTVGKNLGVQKGDGIINTSGAGQKQTLVSKKFKKLKFHGWMHNDGDIAGRMSLSGSDGNKNFKVKYFGPTGNMTGQVVAGTYELTVPPGQKKNYRVEIKPKRKLKNKKTGKIKRKNRTITLKMESSLTAQIDGIKAKGKAR